MAYEKDTCSSCGKYTEITAKVLEDVEKFYCKHCQEKELKTVIENFNKVSFNCMRCGSSNITNDDARTGISLTDVPNVIYVNAFITCNDCGHIIYVKMEDHGTK